MKIRAAFLAFLLALVALILGSAARDREATAAPGEAPPHFVPELGLPATGVVAFGAGATATEGAETWAYGRLGPVPLAGEPSQVDRFTLLRHTVAGGWQPVALPGEGAETPATALPAALGALAGQTTPSGALALMTSAGIVLRGSGGAPALTPPPPAAALSAGESLPPVAAPSGTPTPYSVVDESGGHAGLFIAPYGDGAGARTPEGAPSFGVLHYDGTAWAREPIEAPKGDAVAPLAIGCGPTTEAPTIDSARNCWLLARLSGGGRETLALFRRGPAPEESEPPALGEGEAVEEPGEGEEGSGEPGEESGEEPGEGEPPKEEPGGEPEPPAGEVWAPVEVSGGLLGGQSGPPGGAALAALGPGAQMLTVTAQGAWVDFDANLGAPEPSSATELVEPIAPPSPPGSGSPAPAESTAPAAPTAKVAGSWCFPIGPGCEKSLGAALPAAYRSFAWPGASASDPGTRVITGLPNRGMLKLAAGAFAYAVGPGGSDGAAPGAAAFSSPTAGVIADDTDTEAARDGAGQSQVFTLSTEAPPPAAASEPVPFPHPLMAVAMAPGAEPGNPDAEAIAAGADGELAHYIPGIGWRQDPVDISEGLSLEHDPDSGKGVVRTLGAGPLPTFHAVAWPTTEKAYAIGDRGTVWEWSPEDPVWGREPGQRLFEANFYGIAFSPVDPSVGYLVGVDNILSHTEKSWSPSNPPEAVRGPSGTDYTSIAFAGSEALVTYRSADVGGGVIVKPADGDWEVDTEIAGLLASLHLGADEGPTKVAGLPDGGALVAGPGYVLKREGPEAHWEFAPPLPEAKSVAALAAFRDGQGKLRAMISVGLAPLHPEPPSNWNTYEPTPASGYLLQETATGWRDVEHEAWAVQSGSTELPRRPQPVQGLVVNSDGSRWLGVGGNSGEFSGEVAEGGSEYETAAALRYPPEGIPEPDQVSPVAAPAPAPGTAFMVGGGAACAGPCADQAEGTPGPDALLAGALARTMRGEFEETLPLPFIYTGGRLEAGAGGPGYGRELARLAAIFGASGREPIMATPSPDLTVPDPSVFADAFEGFGPKAGGPAYYAYSVVAPGSRKLRIIVLDLSSGELGPEQKAWLRTELAEAAAVEEESVAVGDASLGFQLPDPTATPPALARDGEEVAAILVEGGAAAYFYDYPDANVVSPVTVGLVTIPAIGTGTLGYGQAAGQQDWLGTSSTVEVRLQAADRSIFMVEAHAIPNITDLTLYTEDGPRLAVGEGALFRALGRVPAGGIRIDEANGAKTFAGPEPYVVMPFPSVSSWCVGPNCNNAVPLEYGYYSSDPQVGDFFGPGDEPNSEGVFPGEPRSGVFCARSPGTTTITVTAGGLSYSEPVTVTAGDEGEGCRVPVPGAAPTGVVEAPSSESPESASPPPPVVHHVTPQPHPVPGSGPAPAPIHHSPVPEQPAPVPPAPTPTSTPSAPLPQVTGPVVSPHPPPGVQPAPPTGVSSQPVPQTSAQPEAQAVTEVANAPAPGVAPAPGMAPERAGQEEAAVQRSHLAVRFHHGAAVVTARHARSGSGSGTVPLAGLLGAAALLALAGGAAVAAFGRRDRPAFESASFGRPRR